MLNKLFLLAILLVPIRLLGQDSNQDIADPNIVLEIPSTPIAWFFSAFLIVVIIALIAVIIFLLKKKIGSDSTLNPQIKKEVENAYARKVKSEYLEKQKVLDQKVKQAKLRFAVVKSHPEINSYSSSPTKPIQLSNT